MAGIKDTIKKKALQLLEEHKDGLRYSELVKMISESDVTLKFNTIGTTIWALDKITDDVYKPAKGLFRLTKYKPAEDEFPEHIEEDKERVGSDEKGAIKVKEEDFYEPFAKWLTNDIEDTTLAIPLGGNVLKDKWGTPDVIGVFASRDRDIIKWTTQVVAAEIKIDSTQLITAFGQSCAYKLFSHKVYLVIPKQAKKEDISRLDSLCQIFGIGLVTFDKNSPAEPEFDILVRPVRQEPDFYYTNKMLSSDENMLKKLFPRY